jgi:hypothetical protein
MFALLNRELFPDGVPLRDDVVDASPIGGVLRNSGAEGHMDLRERLPRNWQSGVLARYLSGKPTTQDFELH